MRVDPTRAGVASLVVAASILSSRRCSRTIPIRLLTEPVRGDESIMSAKSHGTTAEPVQRLLRWGVNRELADRICSFNREGAESSGYFTECREFTKQINWARGMATEPEPITFYDSVTGYLLFRAPVGRTMDAFLSESLRHGWPSFRPAEVLWDHVRVLDDHEVVSTTGTHLGHVLFDSIGARYCINLCSVAGNAVEAPSSSTPVTAPAGEGLKAAWPLLHEIAAAGEWTGSMHYATGADGLSPAPFVLRGSLRAELDGGGRLTLTSSVTLPNGIERVWRCTCIWFSGTGRFSGSDWRYRYCTGKKTPGGAGTLRDARVPVSTLVRHRFLSKSLHTLHETHNDTRGDGVITPPRHPPLSFSDLRRRRGT